MYLMQSPHLTEPCTYWRNYSLPRFDANSPAGVYFSIHGCSRQDPESVLCLVLTMHSPIQGEIPA